MSNKVALFADIRDLLATPWKVMGAGSFTGKDVKRKFKEIYEKLKESNLTNDEKRALNRYVASFKKLITEEQLTKKSKSAKVETEEDDIKKFIEYITIVLNKKDNWQKTKPFEKKSFCNRMDDLGPKIGATKLNEILAPHLISYVKRYCKSTLALEVPKAPKAPKAPKVQQPPPAPPVKNALPADSKLLQGKQRKYAVAVQELEKSRVKGPIGMRYKSTEDELLAYKYRNKDEAYRKLQNLAILYKDKDYWKDVSDKKKVCDDIVQIARFIGVDRVRGILPDHVVKYIKNQCKIDLGTLQEKASAMNKQRREEIGKAQEQRKIDDKQRMIEASKPKVELKMPVKAPAVKTPAIKKKTTDEMKSEETSKIKEENIIDKLAYDIYYSSITEEGTVIYRSTKQNIKIELTFSIPRKSVRLILFSAYAEPTQPRAEKGLARKVLCKILLDLVDKKKVKADYKIELSAGEITDLQGIVKYDKSKQREMYESLGFTAKYGGDFEQTVESFIDKCENEILINKKKTTDEMKSEEQTKPKSDPNYLIDWTGYEYDYQNKFGIGTVNYKSKKQNIKIEIVFEKKSKIITLAWFTAYWDTKKPRAPKGLARKVLCAILLDLVNTKKITEDYTFQLVAANIMIKGVKYDAKKQEEMYNTLGFKTESISATGLSRKMKQTVAEFVDKCEKDIL